MKRSFGNRKAQVLVLITERSFFAIFLQKDTKEINDLLRKTPQTLDGVKAQKMAKKAKNTYRCSKNSLHKKFKLILEQNGKNKQIIKNLLDFKNIHFI